MNFDINEHEYPQTPFAIEGLKKPNYEELILELNPGYQNIHVQFGRFPKKQRLFFLITGIPILIILPIILTFLVFNFADSYEETVYGFLSLLGYLAIIQLYNKFFKNRLQVIQKNTDDFVFEEQIIREKIRNIGYRKKPTIIIVDGAESLDKEPFNIFLDLLQEGSQPYGALWVFLFTVKESDRYIELRNAIRNHDIHHYNLTLKPYSQEQLQTILSNDQSLELHLGHLVKKTKGKSRKKLREDWIDISGRFDNDQTFTEFDILKILAFSGTKGQIEKWNPNSINKLFNDSKKENLGLILKFFNYAKNNEWDFFSLAKELTRGENLNFFQKKRFISKYYVIPMDLRRILLEEMTQEEIVVFHIFWINQYLTEFIEKKNEIIHNKIGPEALAKHVLYRINYISRVKDGTLENNSFFEESLKNILASLDEILNDLFVSLSYLTFNQFLKAYWRLLSYLPKSSMIDINQEKLFGYSIYFFGISGTLPDKPILQTFTEFKVKQKHYIYKVFEFYQRLLNKESPVLLLEEIELIQIEDLNDEPSLLVNLYGFLLLFLRIREADGFVFELRQNVDVTHNLPRPRSGDFPIFELRYRFLLLDVYIIQKKNKKSIETLDEIFERLENLKTEQIALQALKKYWQALADHYLLRMPQNKQFAIGRDVKTIEGAYLDAAFIFELLNLKLPLIDLFYSHGCLIQGYNDCWKAKVNEWYNEWLEKFQLAKQLQADLEISVNIPEIFYKVYFAHIATFSSEKSFNEIINLIDTAKTHNFNERIIFRLLRLKWITIDKGKNPAAALAAVNELIEIGEDEEGFFSYAYQKYNTNEQLLLLYTICWKISYLRRIEQKSESLKLLEYAKTQLHNFKKALPKSTNEENKLITEVEIIQLFEEIHHHPENIDKIIEEVLKEKSYLESERFVDFLLIASSHLESLDQNLLIKLLKLASKNFAETKSLHGEIVDSIESIISHYNENKNNNNKYKANHGLLDVLLSLSTQVLEAQNLTLTCTIDRIVTFCERLQTLNRNETYYQNELIKWQSRRIDLFILEEMLEKYEECSSQDIFLIYLDFFEKYESNISEAYLISSEESKSFKTAWSQYKKDQNEDLLARRLLKLIRTIKIPLIADQKLEKNLLNISISLKNQMHHIDVDEQREVKKILNDLFSPIVITRFLQILKNLPEIPLEIREIIEKLLTHHQRYSSLIK